ncbi:MAG TPA: IS200/IS605 family transposase [Humisphaera sp.]
MPQSLPNLLYYFIWSTKHRELLIDESVEAKLHAYMAGICTSLGGKPILIGGMPDHVHVLTYLPPKVAVSDALRDLKASSSK